MPSDYQKIASDNIRRRGEEFDDIGRWISEQLYSDRTHFVYELLQNAEDALTRRFCEDPDSEVPRRVQFRLFPDRLEFSHFGKLFTEDDVRAISDILRGTKLHEMSQIGKFGIGFKSVYAFTSTPEIHSGDEHFVVERYIRPKKSARIPNLKSQETLFILPFNHEVVTPGDSLRLIANRLSKIGIRTLLFLKSIDQVEWLEGDRVNGAYVKEESRRGSARQVTVIGQHNETEESEDWLVFEQSIPGHERDGTARVEIAFRKAVDEKTGKEKIVKSKTSPLVVFFPTEQETRLGFLAQGPFQTTPARDNVLQNSWNQLLVKTMAQLVPDALSQMKDMGFMSISLLEALTIRADDFPTDGMFRPVFESTRASFMEKPLLPTDKGQFVTAQSARLARGGDLRKLLNVSQLHALCNAERPLQWLSGDLTEIQPPDLWKYLTQELKIEVIDAEAFARKVTLSFMQGQTDDWMKQFYGYLLGQESLWRAARYLWESPGILRNREIIRLSDNKHVKPFKADGQPYAFLPSNGSANYPGIKAEIAKDERSQEFLKKLGIREVGEREILESLLKSYYAKDSPRPAPGEHIKHMRKFVAWSQKPNDNALFIGHFLFLDANQESFWTPDSCYIDLPFKDTGIRCLFQSNPENEPDKVGLWDGYTRVEGFNEFAVSLGVSDKISITKGTIPYNHPASRDLKVDRYGARNTHTGIDEDYNIVGLEAYLGRRDAAVSKLIWDTLRNADPGVLTAKYRPNQMYNVRTAPSTLVLLLRDNEWVPNRNGIFSSPSVLSRSLLPDGFVYDDRNGWLSYIGFGAAVQQVASENEERQRHAKALGIENLESIDIIKEIDSDPDLLGKIRSVIQSEKSKVVFPVRPSPNPVRRKEKLAQDLLEAPEKAHEQRKRNVRVSSLPNEDKETFLRESYTNSEGQMVCQICKKEMPFKKRDGHYYFEAVEALTDQQKEHQALYLALCPTCAAMYKEFIKRDPDSLKDLKQHIVTVETPEVPLRLGQTTNTIRFVEAHFSDLKTIIGKTG